MLSHIIFNLALCNFSTLLFADSSFLTKSLRLYELARTAAKDPEWGLTTSPIVVPILYIFATVNNIGIVNRDLGFGDESKECFEYLLSAHM
jgi:hypothetical protein